MVKNLQDTITLHNGIKMPYVGLGVYKMEDRQEAVHAIHHAIDYGYRSIDTAHIYQNERVVGEAIKDSRVARADLFLTTKVWNYDQGYDSTLKAFEASLKGLNMDYIDLYLIHWPVKPKYLDTWRALERLYDEKLVRAIGVSNFQIHHLEDLAAHSNEKPVINQIECHPRLTQEKLREYCNEHSIAVEAWSPIAKGRLLEEPTLNHIASKHGKTSVQIILRWHLQNGTVIIPKSVREERIKENADLFDFELSLSEMNDISALNLNERIGADPDNFDF
ncbi:aldo/keto reductase [Lederbergia citrea]|uniref:Aldo/keto reductase n=1 Tax=Lederbergia citrea TaxID=2833581 RepID=A0A942UGU8_9BACI|nr:aldo/keto reductase [Lederbergia citrea]MBS4177556.1 aldo/keto reductase [Lederbergia citrea]MBS4204230.1 aldo/keto reductase [Lederbergia citrea]MBS4221185.1 aldo/keto reductase [Lederbergia citrea]